MRVVSFDLRRMVDELLELFFVLSTVVNLNILYLNQKKSVIFIVFVEFYKLLLHIQTHVHTYTHNNVVW